MKIKLIFASALAVLVVGMIVFFSGSRQKSIRITYVATSSWNPDGEKSMIEIGTHGTTSVYFVGTKTAFSKTITDGSNMLVLNRTTGSRTAYRLPINGKAEAEQEIAEKPTGRTKKILGYVCRELKWESRGLRMIKWVTSDVLVNATAGDGHFIMRNSFGQILEMKVVTPNGAVNRVKAVAIETPVKDEQTYFSMKIPAAYRDLTDELPY